MHIAYLGNRLTEAGATFIRHEMASLDKQGHRISPFSVRRPGAADRSFSDPLMPGATTYLLATPGLARTVLHELRTRPLLVLRAARLTYAVGAKGGYGRVRSFLQLVAGVRLASLLRDNDVHHLHNHGLHSAPVALVAATVADVPYSVTTHGPPEFDAPETPHLEIHAAEAAFLVAVTHVVRAEVCRLIPAARWSKVHLVRCGLPSDQLIRPTTPVPDTATIACVARLDERKGQAILLSAVQRLVEQGVHVRVVLVGDGPMREELEAWVADAGLGGHVRFAGWQSSESVAKELEGARGLVLPSLAEGLPLAVMEALAMGRPVIASAVGAVSELVQPDVTGWLVSPADVDSLQTAVNDMLNVPVERLTEMGEAGARLVAQRHCSDREATRLSSLISAVPVGSL